MNNVDRRTILATGALALAGTAVQGGAAAAQAGPKSPAQPWAKRAKATVSRVIMRRCPREYGCS